MPTKTTLAALVVATLAAVATAWPLDAPPNATATREPMPPMHAYEEDDAVVSLTPGWLPWAIETPKTNTLETDRGVCFKSAVDADDLVVVAETAVERPFRAWIQLRFDPDGTRLRDGATAEERDIVRIESALDGAVQELTLADLREWRFRSAFFNGASVRLQLLAHPCNPNRTITPAVATLGAVMSEMHVDQDREGVTLQSRAAPEFNQLGPRQGICGPEDARVPTGDLRVARLFPTQCTAFRLKHGAAFPYVTAGHCGALEGSVMQHAVPPSYEATGVVRHPPPAFQFPVQSVHVAAGVIEEGHDASAVAVAAHRVPDGPSWPFPANAPWYFDRDQRPSLGSFSAGAPLSVAGYGEATGARNQALQVAGGPLERTYGNETLGLFGLLYQVDTQGGNSGSPVIAGDSGAVVAVHTNGGCDPVDPHSANLGTWVNHPALLAALDSSVSVKGQGVQP